MFKKINTKILDSIITLFLTLSIISSFFIIKNLHINKIGIPQLFYLFLLFTIVAMYLRIRTSIEYRDLLLYLIKKFGLYLIFFVFFISINLFYWFLYYKTNGNTPLFFVDLGRVISEIILFVMLIVHLTLNKNAYKYLTFAFFIPLILFPILLFRSVDNLINILPNDFFSGYSLQALQYNPTSLATWLIILFSFSISFLFKGKQEKNIFHIIIFSLSTIITTSFIWWTNSRGALFASIIILIITGWIYLPKQKIKFITISITLFVLFFISIYILPPQAKANILVRYYPQYRQTIKNNNFIINPNNSISLKNSPIPNIINSQNRQNFWPKHILYVLNHPFGIYGPEIIPNKDTIIFQEGEHNTLLQAGKWGGWMAMIIMGLFIYNIFKISINLVKRENSPYILGIITSFLGIFSISMLNSFLQLKTFWIIPAIIFAYFLRKKSDIKYIQNNVTNVF